MIKGIIVVCVLLGGCACNRGPEGASPKSAKKAWTHEAHGEPEPSASDTQPSGTQPSEMPDDDIHGLARQEALRGHGSETPAPANAEQNEAPDHKELNSAGGITWKAPPTFFARRPNNSMRAAEYVLGDANDEQANAELVVYYFGAAQGGGLRENLERWRNQFSPEKRVVKETKTVVDHLDVTTLDVRGVYLGMAMPGQTPSEPKGQQRMLAVVVEGLQGPVFFKVVGQEKLIDANEKAFQSMIRSIKKR